MEIKVKKTTYMVDGCKEKCFEVTNGSVMVRIAKLYHFVGRDSLIMKEYIDGEFNSSEEWNGDFDSLTKKDAKRLALQFSIYLR